MTRTTTGGRHKKPQAHDRMRQTQIRLDDALRKRIDKYQRVEQDRVGYEVGFSAIARKLMERGLDAFEAESRP